MSHGRPVFAPVPAPLPVVLIPSPDAPASFDVLTVEEPASRLGPESTLSSVEDPHAMR